MVISETDFSIGSNLPWNPTISDCYSSLSGPLRSLFQEFVQGLKTYNTLKTATDKKSKQQAEKLAYDNSILVDLIRLFNADPDLPLFPLVSPITLGAQKTPQNFQHLYSQTFTFGLSLQYYDANYYRKHQRKI